MKHAHRLKMRAALRTILGIACLALAPGVALGDWVGDTMCACPGRHKPLGSASSCEEACGLTSNSGGSGNSSYDYEAARRAQEEAAAAERQRQAEAERIERERLAEEKRKKEAEAKFIRDRDEAANSLKGSSGSALGQLKGLAGSDNSGLKGSGFDTGSAGLKELRGSDYANQKTNSQSETTRTSLSGGTSNQGSGNDDSKNKEACRPSQDTSVVDLCFLGAKPAAIDPRILKGMNPAEKTALKTSVNNMTEDLLPFDKEIYQGLADMMGATPTNTGKQWPGPSNPGTRYLNPLTEPEKVKAYWEKVNAGLRTHAEAEAKIATATSKSIDWRDLVARQEADPKFMKSKEKIIQNQDKAEGLARHQMFTKFKDFLEKQGGADWPDRIKNDKLFAARMVMERDALFKKMDQEIYGVRAKALQQMTVLVKGWNPEKPNNGMKDNKR